MTTIPISTDKAPTPTGPFNQAIVAGGFVFTSGQAGRNRETGVMGDIHDQARRCIQHISGVLEAASSLVSRGADALFITGDVTVMVAADSVVSAAKRGRIPVFTIMPPNVKKGAIFDLGANFHDVGVQVGELAAKVLNGTDPAAVPVLNVVPERLTVNKLAFAGLRDSWRMPQATLDHAEMIIDEQGEHKSAPARGASK